MAVDRALVVDVVATSEQYLANAWGARMIAVGSVLGFFLSVYHLPIYYPVRLIPSLKRRNQSRRHVSPNDTTASSCRSLLIAVLFQSSPHDMHGKGEGAAIFDVSGISLIHFSTSITTPIAFKKGYLTSSRQCLPTSQLFHAQYAKLFSVLFQFSVTRLTDSCHAVHDPILVSLVSRMRHHDSSLGLPSAWLGWFPVLFYTTIYIGELHKRASPIPTTPAASRALDAEATRLGSRALFFSSLLSLFSNIVLPFFTTESSQSSSSHGEKGWRQFCRIRLVNLWTLSHIVFSSCMMGTL
jgi:hypothetical protein